MTQTQIFKLAHEETKKIKKVNPEINYSCQFGLCLSQLQAGNMKIENMELKELKELKERIEKMIAEKTNENAKTYTFDFEYKNDPRKGTPYAAKLYINDENKLSRNFFEMDKAWGKKEITIHGQYEAQEGDIIEQREGGSWKNDYRYWYIVEAGKLVMVADIDNSKQKIQVEKYLKGKISKEDLLKNK